MKKVAILLAALAAKQCCVGVCWFCGNSDLCNDEIYR